MKTLIMTLAVSMLPALDGETSLFPDGTFDRTGNSVEGRGGGNCLTVSAQEKIRWRGSRSTELRIEPFARYRITGYARARGKGELRALLGYGWNSFDWRYQCGQNVPPDGEWHRCEVTFSCPRETYTLHPAALLGAEDAQVWVDDVSVEKIAEPELVLAEIAAKPEWSMEEREILARAHIAAGEPEKAVAVAEGADLYSKADIYCTLVLAADDNDARGIWLTRMLVNAGPAYHNALTRLAEIAAGRPGTVLLGWLDAAAGDCTEGDAAMAHALTTICFCRQIIGEATTCTEVKPLLERARATLEQARNLLETKQCMPRYADAFNTLTDRLTADNTIWDKRIADLGNCRISINGTPLTAGAYDVVVPPDAAPHEDYAAGQLRLYLERLTGTAPDPAKGKPAAGRRGLYVGRPPESAARKLAASVADLGEEAFLIQTVGDDLFIVGGLRGALYGVYSLLEDRLGCGWYMPGPLGEVIPRNGEFRLDNLNDLQRPSFTWRGLSSVGDAEWCIRNKIDPTISGSGFGIDRGDPPFFGSFGHNYSRLIPPGEYFLTHPEYFSLVKGERRWDHTQICTTNPDVIRLCAEGICRDIERRPECRVFALCQNDWAGWCECESCKALDTRPDSVTDRLMVFCNAVSALVREKYPDKQIYTYAYQAGVEPPEKIRPDPALGVQLCHIRHPCSHSHPIETALMNRQYRSWVEGWTDVTDQLFIYDYRVDYSNYLMPYPNCYAIIRDVPYYHRRGVRSLFYQGGGNAHNFGLCHYLLAKLMWNVNTDPDTLVNRFFTQYYGPAAEPMKAYWQLLHDSVYEKNIEMNLYSSPPADLFTPEFFAKADACFDEAAGRAGTGIILDRIEWERITLHWVKLAMNRRERQIVLTRDALTVQPAADTDWRRDLAEFIRIARKFRIWRIRESPGRGDVDIRGFVGEVSGMDVHGRCDYRYPAGESPEGQRCVTVRANVDAAFPGWSQRYAMILKGNEDYVAVCRVRTEGDSHFTAVPLELRGAVSAQSEPVTESRDWHEISLEFHTPDRESAPATATVGRTLRGSGQIWVDDLRITRRSRPDTNEVQNGNFERRRGVVPDYWTRPGNGSDFAWAEMSPVREFLAAPETCAIPGQETQTYPVVTLENELIRVSVVPGLGGRIQGLVDKRSGMNFCYVAKTAGDRNGWINYGGYEEYTSPDLGGPGWDCPYQARKNVTEDGDSLVLTAVLRDRTIERTITLPKNAPELRISSRVTNTGTAPIKTRLRIHPVLRIGGRPGSCGLIAKQRDGTLLQRRVTNERQDIWLKDAEFAAGAWALRSEIDGAGIVNFFDPAQVDTAYICVQPDEGINLELMSPVTTLAPRGTLGIAHRYVLMAPGTPPETYTARLKD